MIRVNAFSSYRAAIANTSIHSKSLHSSAATSSKAAFVFDIDGVLLRGSKAIPEARQALSLLNHSKIPFILLTNGGGVSEKQRAQKVSTILDFPIDERQVVQSHTPLKALAQNKTFSRVLVVGGPGDSARHCAIGYGFQDVLMPIDLVHNYPAMCPHHQYLPESFNKFALKSADTSIPIEAVFVFNDPREFGSDLQVVLDILNSDSGRVGTQGRFNESPNEIPAVPIIFSNNDFLWANDYPLPRFGQGAFRILVEALYREFNSLAPHQNLKSTIMGKPFPVAYHYGHHVLIDWYKTLTNLKQSKGGQIVPQFGQAPTNSPFETIYMVGDNPASDILGANNVGWASLLVRTGVYKDRDWNTMAARPTGGVFDNVLRAVQYGLEASAKK